MDSEQLVSQHHNKIKNDPRWKEAKAACHERDGWACIECGSTEDLQCDHIIRIADAMELAFELDNLQTLCGEHHRQKEREYESRRLVRVNWINPRYPELGMLIETESESEAMPVL